jgi:hypothetical protein
VGVSDFANRYREVREIIQRAAKIHAFGQTENIEPKRFIAWARKELPECTSELDKLAGGKTKGNINSKDAQMPFSTEDSEYGGISNSLYIFVLGMSIKHYGFDPGYDPNSKDPNLSKSPAIAAIGKDLHAVGAPLSPKTIRRCLIAAIATARRLDLKPKRKPKASISSS